MTALEDRPPHHPLATGRKAVWSWCLFDFANSAFTTLIVTFIYATWFTRTMAPDENIGTQRWGWGITATALLVAFLAPLIGRRADERRSRKQWLAGTTFVCIAASVALAFIEAPHWILALSVFVLGNVCYELSQALYNGFLPHLADSERIGRISGYAWGLGYIGGLLCLVVGLLFTGIPGLLDPLLSTERSWNIRATTLLVALWFFLFALPAFRWLPEPPAAPLRRSSVKARFRTIRHVFRYKQVLRLLIARLIYNDGLVAIFAFGGIYAGAEFGFDFGDILIFGIVLNLAAGSGAWIFGFLDDRLGGKRVILLSLCGLIFASALAAWTPDVRGFWVAGLLIGLMVGPNQSASRSLMARMIPPKWSAEFFGLFAFSGKLTSFMGALLLGTIAAWTGQMRLGVASVLLFFVTGAILLLFVDERAGIAEAHSLETESMEQES